MGFAAVAFLALQLVVSNPTKVIFNCPDHDQDTGHEVDIVRLSDGQVIQTLNIGDPPADAQGDVTAVMNVQPVKFGTYFVRVRSIAASAEGPLKSEDSDQSPNWTRTPGKPGGVRVGN